MAVPAGGEALGDLGEGLDYLPPWDRRWEALQLRSLERGGRGRLGQLLPGKRAVSSPSFPPSSGASAPTYTSASTWSLPSTPLFLLLRGRC
jgi:hypothetical protein